MPNSITQDRKMNHLLNRVGKDVSQLKSDVASLLNHTGRHAIPDSARDLRDSARDRLHAGGHYAASQLRHIRSHPGQSSTGILGGLILLGAVGAGIYYLCKCNGKPCHDETPEVEDEDFETPGPASGHQL